MNFDTPLIPATLIRRYKRFLADVTLNDGREITAHVANPGSMLGMKDEGLRVWLEPNDDPKRKLKYSWKIAELDGGAMVGVDTGMPNKIVGEALRNGLIPELIYQNVKPEVKYGENSRIDFLLSEEGKVDCYVEIKSVTLSRQTGLAEFPDSVTARGAKHMGELANVVQSDQRAVILYLLQRNDCDRFDIAGDIDPKYQTAFMTAREAGVEVLCYRTNLSQTGIEISEKIPLAFA
ncbi:DNA/RNA nuclease SfsA [Amylibacter sp. SFDW26]|uniref:DNA/RNA nuclease SfsA n=1 Tax=Amylibacter sp. SFDW26 TaxID=2652722 RepID=UPI0012624032|nr:DNA/RNA nuclease SfsA [Amylibacter sp. SFDW26]KAB7614593.1 DNA/RNA nuclease SfsA [Amylibacter sp. SFDW26]